MSIYEEFEQHFSDMHDCYPEHIKAHRLSNGSYNEAHIATAFRYFRAGFESNTGHKLQILGYLSNKGVLSASQSRAAFFNANQTETKCVAVYIKQCEAHKTGDMT